MRAETPTVEIMSTCTKDATKIIKVVHDALGSIIEKEEKYRMKPHFGVGDHLKSKLLKKSKERVVKQARKKTLDSLKENWANIT